MTNIENPTLQDPSKVQLENSSLNSATISTSASAANKLNIKALLSLIFGILGIPIPFLGFVGILLGIYARQEIVKGKNLNWYFALAGIIFGAVFTIAYVIYVFVMWHNMAIVRR